MICLEKGKLQPENVVCSNDLLFCVLQECKIRSDIIFSTSDVVFSTSDVVFLISDINFMPYTGA